MPFSKKSVHTKLFIAVSVINLPSEVGNVCDVVNQTECVKAHSLSQIKLAYQVTIYDRVMVDNISSLFLHKLSIIPETSNKQILCRRCYDVLK